MGLRTGTAGSGVMEQRGGSGRGDAIFGGRASGGRYDKKIVVCRVCA